jgi:hypothetical protein
MHTHCPVCYQSGNYVQVVSPSFLIPKRESDGIFERKKKEGRKEKMNTGKNKKKKGEKEARRKKERKENSFSKLFYLNVDFSQNQLLTLSKVLEILV